MNQSAYTRQSGQVILILLLLVAAGLAIGLLAVSRSSVDTQLSTKIERESKVFSANEAIVENILKNPSTSDQITNIDQVKVTSSRVTIPANTSYEFPISDPIPIGETQTIWLTGHDPASPYAINDATNTYGGGSINICWDGPASNPSIPGIVTMVLYKEAAGIYNTIYGAYANTASSGACGTSGQLTINGPNPPPNCFTYVNPKSAGNCGISANNYKQTISIPIGGTIVPVLLRVRPVFAPISRLGIQPSSGASLPSQALTDANVFAQHTVSGESSKIRVFRSYPAPPAIFDYVLFSGLSL